MESIGRVCKNQNLISIISAFAIEVTRLSEIRVPHFLDEIIELLRRNQLVAEYDTLVKNGVIDTV